MAKIGFVGCHEISWHCLKKICELADHTNDQISIVFNLTEEERQKHSAFIQFETLQREREFELHNVKNVSDEKNVRLLKQKKLDILFIIGWHRIVPQSVLDVAPIKLGIHSSLLPKNRGSSPLNWNLINDDEKTGVSLFHLTEGVDSGEIVDQMEFDINKEDYIEDLYHKATIVSLNILEKNWDDIHSLKPNKVDQQEIEATINKRRSPKDGRITWSKSSKECYNFIRALSKPYPGAFAYFNSKKVFIWKSNMVNRPHTNPGEIIDIRKKMIISTGDKSLQIVKIQIEDEPICSAELFIKTYNIKIGDRFD